MFFYIGLGNVLNIVTLIHTRVFEAGRKSSFKTELFVSLLLVLEHGKKTETDA